MKNEINRFQGTHRHDWKTDEKMMKEFRQMMFKNGLLGCIAICLIALGIKANASERFLTSADMPEPTGAFDLADRLSDGTDLDKLCEAIGQHETKRCGVNSNFTRVNNCHGIMAWDKQGRRYPRPFETTLDSHNECKRIWRKFYVRFPDKPLANKYSGSDRATAWLNNVTYFYNKF